MHQRMKLLVTCLVSLAAPLALGQGIPGGGFPSGLDGSVVVRVWPGADRCSVLDRNTTCSRVSGVLLRASTVSRDSVIYVQPQGKDEDTMMRASHVATDLRASGFHRVQQAEPPPGA